MKPVQTGLFCAIAVLFLALASEARAGMTGAEIKALVSGKVIAFAGRHNGTVGLRRDGSAWLKTSSGRKLSGTWWVEGNRFCRRWLMLNTRCVTLTRMRNGTVKSSTGYTYTLK